MLFSRLCLVLLLSYVASGSRSRSRSRSRSKAANRLITKSSNKTNEFREGKFLSLFNLVTFKNEACNPSGDETLTGICMSSSECSNSGSNGGSCAAGFGVCCILSVKTCGSVTVDKNCTYLESPGYPNSYTTEGTCTYNIKKCRSDICQIRLDFEELTMEGPQLRQGQCLIDSWTVTRSFTQDALPTLCGKNINQHMYIDAGYKDNSAITLTALIGSSSFGRKWRVKVSQLECAKGQEAADPNCLQWFTGVSGKVRSYNYEADANAYQHLANQYYSLCVRQETGYCSIQWTQCNEPFSFKITRDGNNERGRAGPVCRQDYIIIEHSTNQDNLCMTRTPGLAGLQDRPTADRYCGGMFSCVDGATMGETITSSSFRILVNLNNQDNNAETLMSNNRGFGLNYRQIPCGQ